MGKCEKCHGTGKVVCATCGGQKEELCKECKGEGKHACGKCSGHGKVACADCGGSGVKTDKCPVCNAGKVVKTRWVTCHHCNGTGRRIWARGTERTWRCPYCEGHGQVREKYEEFCPNCHGEYLRKKPCERCGGTGTRTCSSCDGQKIVKCLGCGGSGKIACKSCSGRGEVECGLCKGVGSYDVKTLCKSLIDIAEERGDCESLPFVCKARITDEVASAILDAANRGVEFAACVAAGICSDEKYEALVGGKAYWEYLKPAAESGDKIAQYMLPASSDEELEEEDWDWVKKSAGQGFVPALEMLAACYYEVDGDERKKDLHKALDCWQKILRARDSDAWNEKTIKMAELRVKYLPDIMENDYRAMLELGKALIALQPKLSVPGQDCHCPYVDVHRDGLRWLKEAETAIGKGDYSVVRDLMELYWKMDGKIYDPVQNKSIAFKDKAFALCKRMADSGDTISQSALGERLRSGDGVEKDARMAFVYLYRAAENGDVKALRRLAHLYRDGEYASESRANANELYVRAAKCGDGWSLYEIGKCYLDGKEVKKDEVEAKRLLKLAADKGVEKAKMALSTISDSVKIKDNGPSGIVVGKPDKGSLPKFVCEDYKNAELGKPAVKASEKKSSSGSVRTSTKKRWKFVVLGLLLGFFGIHLAYAKRWFLFLLLWAGFIIGNVMSDPKKETTNVSPEVVAEQVQSESKSDKESSNPISNIGFAVWVLLWIGGTLFIKKDGKGNRM